MMDIHIQVPEKVLMEEVEAGLSAVADELHVDISVSR
jgi:glycine cleavage system regulatory protein